MFNTETLKPSQIPSSPPSLLCLIFIFSTIFTKTLIQEKKKAKLKKQSIFIFIYLQVIPFSIFIFASLGWWFGKYAEAPLRHLLLSNSSRDFCILRYLRRRFPSISLFCAYFFGFLFLVIN